MRIDRYNSVMNLIRARSWNFNGSVENEARLKPLWEQVEAHVQLPARCLCRYFATSEDVWLLQRFGKNFRGVHITYAGRNISPDVQRCFYHQQVGFPTNVTFEET